MTDSLPPILRRVFCLVLFLAGATTSLSAAAQPCDPEASEWIPSRYYPAGTVVFHEGDWYESRELHQGLEPGITFEWIELDSVPDCGKPGRAPEGAGKDAAGSAANGGGGKAVPETPKAGPSERGMNDLGQCEKPDPWQFSRSYTVGSLATHGGQIWEAIRPTNGDMPGMTEPPRWQLVKEHCALEAL